MENSANLSPLKNLRADVPAAVVVALVAMPLCLGVALASGAPLISGLIAGVVGGLLVPLFSRSHLAVSGPTPAIVATVLVAMQVLPSFSAFLLAVVIAGGIQIVLGIVRAGVVAYFFPSAVIQGILSAIGIIIILKQFPYAIGFDLGEFGGQDFISAHGENTFSGVIAALAHLEWGALLISVLTLSILITWDKVAVLRKQTWLSGPLMAVVFGTLLNALLLYAVPELAVSDQNLVNLPIIHSFADLRGMLQMPDWGMIGSKSVWVTAVALTFIASLESLLSIEAADKLDTYKRRTPLDRELLGQGIANIASGLIGGLPVAAVIVRSTANVAAGARTKASAFLHGLFLLFAVLFLATLMNRIPLAALASILIFVGFKLAHPSIFKRMFRLDKSQYLPFVITIVAILLSSLITGVVVGLLAGVFFVLKANYHSAIEIGREGSAYKIALNREVTFVNKARLSHILERLPKGAEVILDGEHVGFIDHDVLEVIRDFERSAPLRGIRLREQGFDTPVLRAPV
ncbi:SulP family inorganic anion transporter [Acidithiobacillus ferriphilus]|uniref:SulP family inorganic anion transporter n=2 Tax=Acidithiobacillus ferriphilus TaxID=1689834 RepID=UPI001C0618A2|nr:SulP family inorganic anion transporter [Acidithiobacillus ferriphilus]MBU2784550.1 SulP family inorganic anion transporter [Acidithiobacillus ferriphilus]UEP58236.1 SulP family inorganic anion transporter [Acidithiobacillus ferriphilus]